MSKVQKLKHRLKSLGSRDLAQLIYDKDVRLLVASQAAEVAPKCEQLQHRLLLQSVVTHRGGSIIDSVV